ncbi:MAG TPA: hypothetical protein VII72_02910 [Myxococcota bacterium]|jgi:hypothetical protein
MRRLAVSAALALSALALLAVACGRYGSPHRTSRSPAPAQAVPVTDPAVTQ